MSGQIISVIGSGTMGNGIAHVSALNGYKVFLVDINDSYLENAMNTIIKNLTRQVDKNIIMENDKLEAIENITLTTNMLDVKNSDLVIEAVPENIDIKNKIFTDLDSICSSKTILSSNTSSISIAKIAENTKRAEKVIGMHFMNPVPIMKLVEIVSTPFTSLETKNMIVSIAKKMQKIPVHCNDYPGFVSNRILMPMINEAVHCFEEGVASVESIDSIMKLGMGHPMGPLKLADLIGIDVCVYILNVLYDGFKDKKYKPSKLLVKMVEENKLGKKSGEGFYKYEF